MKDLDLIKTQNYDKNYKVAYFLYLCTFITLFTGMKHFLITLSLMFVCLCTTMAQNSLNDKADNIIGEYQGKQNEDVFKVKITKLSDGTYQGQISWMQNSCDKNGNKLLDEKNPNKSLRNTPCDQIVLFSGLKYNERKHRWEDTKIYDPQRGLKANLTAEFTKDGLLKLRGSILGLGESVYWTKLN